MDRESHRAAVDAGYASLAGYIEKWGDDMKEASRKRYADDVTVQDMVRLRVENERYRKALLDCIYVLGRDGAIEGSLRVMEIATAAVEEADSK